MEERVWPDPKTRSVRLSFSPSKQNIGRPQDPTRNPNQETPKYQVQQQNFYVPKVIFENKFDKMISGSDRPEMFWPKPEPTRAAFQKLESVRAKILLTRLINRAGRNVNKRGTKQKGCWWVLSVGSVS